MPAECSKTDRAQLADKAQQLVDRVKHLEKERDQAKGQMASAVGDDLAGRAQEIGGIQVLVARIDGADAKTLRDTLDQLKNKLKTAAVLLASVVDGKVSLVAGVTPDATGRLKAGDLVNVVAQQVGGKGGGRPDMAQAGGTDPGALDAALASVPDWVRERLR